MRDSSLCVDSALPVFVLHHLPVGSLWIFARFQHSASYFRHSVARVSLSMSILNMPQGLLLHYRYNARSSKNIITSSHPHTTRTEFTRIHARQQTSTNSYCSWHLRLVKLWGQRCESCNDRIQEWPKEKKHVDTGWYRLEGLSSYIFHHK